MATPKRYYWMKLKESFMTSDTIDYFMSQPDGANYVVLYQMLCLKTINTGGQLRRQIGEVIIPFDIEKIQRDCKWFSVDTIRIALNLYKAFGLVYEDADGTLILTDHKNLVGSESDAAARMRASRENRAALPEGVTQPEHCANIVTPDIRDKRLDIRDKSLEIEKEKKTASLDAFEQFAVGDDRLLEALKGFEEMRKKQKNPLTDRAKKILITSLKKLASDPDEQIMIVDQSVANGWKGFYELKTAAKGAGDGWDMILKEAGRR